MSELSSVLLEDVHNIQNDLRSRVTEWGGKNYRAFPWRNNRSPYSVLLSEVLLKRTTATAVNSIFENFIKNYPDLQSLENSRRQEIENHLVRIGYHKRRAIILQEIAGFIIANFGSSIPCSKTDLLLIPHVGEYTASAILTFGFSKPSAIVDSNVERIIKRVFQNQLPLRPNAILQIASILAPIEKNQNYNYGLLDLGALVCRYGAPKCSNCPIYGVCDYYSSTLNYLPGS